MWRTGFRSGVVLGFPAIAAVLAATHLKAQTREEASGVPREVLIGVLSIGQPAASATPAIDDAQRSYADALTSLRNGQTELAQRKFEQLVARYPQSPRADEAREQLAKIYMTTSGLRRQAALPGSEQISHLGRPLAEINLPQPPVGEWRTSVQAAAGFSRSLQEDFRSAAGDLVFFSEGSVELGSRARKALAQQAEWLKQNPSMSAVIEGHADETGSADDLKALSAARADAVRARLIERGVSAERIRVIAYGVERRVAHCDDQACAGQNRRVATTIEPARAVSTATR